MGASYSHDEKLMIRGLLIRFAARDLVHEALLAKCAIAKLVRTLLESEKDKVMSDLHRTSMYSSAIEMPALRRHFCC